MGKTLIKKSLRTSDLKEARKRRNIETVRVDALFAQYEAGESGVPVTATTKKPGTTDIPFSVLEEHVRRAVIQMVPTSLENAPRLYPGKSLATVLKLAENKPEQRLAPLTQRSYLDTFENIMAQEHFQAKWIPVRVKKMRQKKQSTQDANKPQAHPCSHDAAPHRPAQFCGACQQEGAQSAGTAFPQPVCR